MLRLIEFVRFFKIFILRIFKKIKNTKFDVIEFGYNNRHVFFGYYDLNPFSKNNSKLLFHSVPLNIKEESVNAQIGYVDLITGVSVIVGETSAWCWQQGSRLQWFTFNEIENGILYNTVIGNRYVSEVFSIDKQTIVKRFEYPIYDISTRSNFALSLNFSRLQNLRPGYGYNNFPDIHADTTAPENDGVYISNLLDGNLKLIISLTHLLSIVPHDSMKEAMHYVNHLSFNPSGSRFLFFHLWTNGRKRFSRLFTSDITGQDLFLLENEYNVSHYSWMSDNEILITALIPGTGVRYIKYMDQSTSKEIISSVYLTQDGHPSINKFNSDLILSDTYPNKYSERCLFTVNLKTNDYISIGSFYSNYRLKGEVRCDLHPRWSEDGKMICFDSSHRKRRTINIIKL